jgi:hypothetical protein
MERAAAKAAFFTSYLPKACAHGIGAGEAG